MINKTILKEVQNLEERIKNSLSFTENVARERQKVEEEYALAKKQQEKKSIHLAKIRNSQQLKIDNLTSAFEDLEVKFRAVNEELQELESWCKDDADELSKLTAEIPSLIKANEKKIKSLKGELEEAKQDLREEKALDLELEKSHRNALKKMSEDFKQKLENERKSYSERNKKAEDRYNAKAQPLLFRVECLDSEIEDAERKISSKPDELEALKKRHDKLTLKYSKLSSCRFHPAVDTYICKNYNTHSNKVT